MHLVRIADAAGTAGVRDADASGTRLGGSTDAAGTVPKSLSPKLDRRGKPDRSSDSVYVFHRPLCDFRGIWVGIAQMTRRAAALW